MLKDLHVIVLVQFPIIVSDFVKAIDESGKQVSTEELRKTIGMGRDTKIDLEHIRSKPDLITWRTNYIGEIPLYDFVNECVIQIDKTVLLNFKRFNSTDFSVKKHNPCANLRDEAGVQLAYQVDVYSLYFSFERPLNCIITLYDTKSDLDDNDIKTILNHVKDISEQTMVFHAEKLISTIFNVFCKAKTPDGSTYAFEAFLYLIKFFKS